jgi:hypothetical protein
MRSLIEINKKIYDVSGLRVGKWYISYSPNDGKRLLFKYRECSGSYVFDSGCYLYWCDRYDNGDTETFDLCDGYYCVRASNGEVRKYFPE